MTVEVDVVELGAVELSVLEELVSGDLAAQDNPKTTPGVTLTVPAGTSIELAPDPPTSEPILALPGTNDISVFAGQTMTITEPGTAGLPITVPDGAKISFLGRASMTLPAGASIEAPAGQPSSSVKCSSLRFTSVFAIPHSSQVVAAQMWTMLAAASLTMFGIGAELGLLSVLAASLSTAWRSSSCTGDSVYESTASGL